MAGQFTLGYLGPQGTFTQRAAVEFSRRHSADLKAFPSIPHILNAVDQAEVELGIVPVENSIEGTVNITLDMLAHELDLFINGEIVIDIQHFLLGNNANGAGITKICSHPQALAQCHKYLYEFYPAAERIAVNSTAEAVQKVKARAGGFAAIGSLWAAERYGLHVISSNISDNKINQTRFLILGKKNYGLNKPTKTSLCLALRENKPGELYEILEIFAREQIDLSKIESRPAKDELGNYIFFLDCKIDIAAYQKDIIGYLKSKCKLIKVLGCYGNIKGDNHMGYQEV
ncbi:MAG: prephenate dehydratase [Peptococcaceae bacterium]